MAVQRANDRCEIDQTYGEKLTWHHVFGRSHIVAEPWASWYPLTIMLCLQHHMNVHVDTQLRREVEWIAIDRFIVATRWETEFWKDGDWTPIEIIKTMIRELEAGGIKPNEFYLDGRI